MTVVRQPDGHAERLRLQLRAPTKRLYKGIKETTKGPTLKHLSPYEASAHESKTAAPYPVLVQTMSLL